MIFWVFVVVALAGVICSPVACTMHEDQLIGEQIAAGRDPIAVRCAFEGSSSGTDAVCIVAAAKVK